jgi:hypothetical protein
MDWGMLQVALDMWTDCIHHVVCEEDQMWRVDGLTEEFLVVLIVDVGKDSNASSEVDMEGIEPLGE